jgi:hypothetical protein
MGKDGKSKRKKRSGERSGSGANAQKHRKKRHRNTASAATGADEAQPVGVLHVNGHNTVDVDAAALTAEADSIAAAASPAPEFNADKPAQSESGAVTSNGAAAPGNASWLPVCPGVVQVFDTFICPNWELTTDEKNALAESLAPVLDDLFPGGLGSERWAPYARFALICAGVVVMRVDRETGKLPPLRIAPPKKEQATADAAQGHGVSPPA